jgi:DnaD/phage-associated family protein
MAARLLFIGLWTLADREGRLEDRPKRIKASIFPYDDCNVDGLLDALADNEEKFIARYEADGGKYIQINNFVKQQGSHINSTEAKSQIPAPPAGAKSSADAAIAIPEHGHSDAESDFNHFESSFNHSESDFNQYDLVLDLDLDLDLDLEPEKETNNNEDDNARAHACGADGGDFGPLPTPEPTGLAHGGSAARDESAQTGGQCAQNDVLAAAVQAYEREYGDIPPSMALAELPEYAAELPTEVIAHAFRVAVAERKRNWSYVRAILRDYRAKGYRAVADIQRDDDERQRKKQQSQGARASPQRGGNMFLQMLREKGGLDHDGNGDDCAVSYTERGLPEPVP